MNSRFSKIMLVLSLALTLSIPRLALAGSEGVVVEHPTALAMAGDAIIARPLLLVATGLGTVMFIATLPFSLLGGNSSEAANTLVVQPGKATFVRCLGCKRSGYKKTVQKIEGSEE